MRSAISLGLLCGFALSGAAEAENFRMACHVKDLCAGVEPGGGRILDCLRMHKDELSEKCLATIGLSILNRPGRGQPGSAATPPGSPGGQEEMEDPGAQGAPGAAPPAQGQPAK
jgi:hypothetical protein